MENTQSQASPNPCFREIPLEQGSQEWLSFRRRHVTATEVAHLWAGATTFSELKAVKTGQKKAPDLSAIPAVREGKFFEPWIRRAAGLILASREPGIFSSLKEDGIPAPVLERLDEPFFMASLDGLLPDGSVLEIKNTYSRRKAGYSDVELHGVNSSVGRRLGYYAQVQWEMYCAGASRCYLATHQGIPKGSSGAAFNPRSIRLSVVERDDGTIGDLLKIAGAFKSYLSEGKEPENLAANGIVFGPLTDDEAGLQARLKALDSVDSRIRELDAEARVLKEMKSQYADELCSKYIPQGSKKAEGKYGGSGSYVLSRTERTGALDLEALLGWLVTKGIKPEEIEQFRKAGTVTNRVTIKP